MKNNFIIIIALSIINLFPVYLLGEVLKTEAARIGGDVPSCWEFTSSDQNHSILISSSLISDIDGTPIQPGDFIGLFFESDGDEFCAGFGEWMGDNLSITAWGDDMSADSPEKDGFSVGEMLRIRVWSNDNAKEFAVEASYASVGTGGFVTHTNMFANNGISLITELIAIEQLDACGELIAPISDFYCRCDEW